MRTKFETPGEISGMASFIEEIKRGFDLLTDPIIITDSDGGILYANKAVEEKTGFSREEMFEKTPGELWGNLMDESFYESMWRTIKVEKRHFCGMVRNWDKRGFAFDAELNIYPILDGSGAPLFFVGIEKILSAVSPENPTSDKG